jgi:hypothetical protein
MSQVYHHTYANGGMLQVQGKIPTRLSNVGTATDLCITTRLQLHTAYYIVTKFDNELPDTIHLSSPVCVCQLCDGALVTYATMLQQCDATVAGAKAWHERPRLKFCSSRLPCLIAWGIADTATICQLLFLLYYMH